MNVLPIQKVKKNKQKTFENYPGPFLGEVEQWSSINRGEVTPGSYRNLERALWVLTMLQRKC